MFFYNSDYRQFSHGLLPKKAFKTQTRFCFLTISCLLLAQTTGVAAAETVCKPEQTEVVNREGHVIYDDEHVWLESRSWRKRDGTYSYEYCVSNTHPYTTLYVEWEGHRKFIRKPARAKAQGKLLVRYYNLSSAPDNVSDTDFRYGKTTRNQEEEQIETVFETVAISREPIERVQFTVQDDLGFDFMDALSEPALMEEFRDYLAQDTFGSGYTVNLMSFGNVWLPSSEEHILAIFEGEEVPRDIVEYEVGVLAWTAFNPSTFQATFQVRLSMPDEASMVRALNSDTLKEIRVSSVPIDVLSGYEGVYDLNFQAGSEMSANGEPRFASAGKPVFFEEGSPIEVVPGVLQVLIGESEVLSLQTEYLVQK